MRTPAPRLRECLRCLGDGRLSAATGQPYTRARGTYERNLQAATCPECRGTGKITVRPNR